MKRSTKRRLHQLVMLAVLALVVAWIGFSVDWAAVQRQFFNADGLRENWGDLILVGAKNTIIYTLIAFAGGLVLAIVLALMKLSEFAPYRWIATAYIEFFRGLPALLTILLVTFGVPIAFNWTPPAAPAGSAVFALILVASAYMAETLRAGIQAVPKGQSEAARSLGMSAGKTTGWIVVPQAFRIVIPPLTNEVVLLLKDTALVAAIAGSTQGSRELTKVAQDMTTSGVSAGTSTALIMAGFLYLAITLPLTRLVAWMEKKQKRAR